MQYVFDAASLLCCSLIVFQDFRKREISVFPLILLFVTLLAGNSIKYSFSTVLATMGYNMLFISANLVLLLIYFSIREGKWTNIVDKYLGLGDILFFIAVCAAFSLPNFLLYFLLSLLVTIAGVLVLRLATRRAAGEIPLAGSMAGVFGLLIVVSHILQSNIFYDSRIILELCSPVFNSLN